MRPVRSLQIPPEVEKSPTDFTDLHRFFLRRFFVTQISQMRPVRSLQIPPEVGKSPTDFTDIHRFFLGCFFVTQISQMTQIFFLMGFFSSDFTEIIRRLTAETIMHGFSRMRPVRSLQILPEIGQRDSTESP